VRDRICDGGREIYACSISLSNALSVLRCSDVFPVCVLFRFYRLPVFSIVGGAFQVATPAPYLHRTPGHSSSSSSPANYSNGMSATSALVPVLFPGEKVCVSFTVMLPPSPVLTLRGVRRHLIPHSHMSLPSLYSPSQPPLFFLLNCPFRERNSVRPLSERVLQIPRGLEVPPSAHESQLQ
jgi:hypothetical protein